MPRLATAWRRALPGIWLVVTAGLGERDTGERGQAVHELVLESRITGLWCGLLPLPVVPVAAAHRCRCVVADGQPCLREVSHLQVVGRCGAAHLGRDPARIDGVAEYVRPRACEGERERGDMELALGVRLCSVPRPPRPVDIPERPGTCVMQSA